MASLDAQLRKGRENAHQARALAADIQASVREVALPELCGHNEAAAILGVTPKRFHKIRATRPDCPKPDVTLACGPVWQGPRIRAYAKSRKERTT